MSRTANAYLVRVDKTADTLVMAENVIEAMQFAIKRFSKEPRYDSLRYETIECTKVYIPKIELWYNDDE